MIENINKSYTNYFDSSITKNSEKLLKLIQGLNLKYAPIKIDTQELKKHELYLFHLISDYHLAYVKSTKEEKAYRTNTLESLGKRNENRQKRFDKNKEIEEEKTKKPKERLTAMYENLILDLYIKRKRKFANLILSNLFIHKGISYQIQRHLFINTKTLNIIFEAQNDAMKFFEFTYISKSKTANSCLICIYTYLTKVANVNEDIAFKFTENIRKELFKEDAVQKLLKKYLDSQISCDGIYNGTPIFHWYTPKDKNLYTNEDLEEYIKTISEANKDIGFLKNIIYKIFFSKQQISKKEFDKYLSEKKHFEKVLLGLCESYVRNPNKLIEHFIKNEKKTYKYYLFFPFRLICTIFLYSNTKSTH